MTIVCRPFCHSIVIIIVLLFNTTSFQSVFAKFAFCIPQDVIEASTLNIFKNRLISASELSVIITIVMHLRSYAQTCWDLVFQGNIKSSNQYSLLVSLVHNNLWKYCFKYMCDFCLYFSVVTISSNDSHSSTY